MGLEVEARFRADPASLHRLATLPRLGEALLGEPATVDEVDRYLDTDDGRLAAARWACRLRTRGPMTKISLKGPPQPTDGDAWLHRRAEVEGPATDALDPATWPPSEARDRLDDLRRGRPLLERFRLVQRRTERAVALDGDVLGTLTLDAVSVLSADGRPAGGIEIAELELRAADARSEAALRPLAAALAAEGLAPEPRTKLELAIDLLGSA